MYSCAGTGVYASMCVPTSVMVYAWSCFMCACSVSVCFCDYTIANVCTCQYAHVYVRTFVYSLIVCVCVPFTSCVCEGAHMYMSFPTTTCSCRVPYCGQPL